MGLQVWLHILSDAIVEAVEGFEFADAQPHRLTPQCTPPSPLQPLQR